MDSLRWKEAGWCGNYLPGSVWELLARSSVGTTCQVQCVNYLPGPVWELLARSSVGTTCQVQCGNYLPGPVCELLARSSVGTTCQVQCGNYLPGPVWELLARSSVGTTCQVQCGNYLPGPVWSMQQSYGGIFFYPPRYNSVFSSLLSSSPNHLLQLLSFMLSYLPFRGQPSTDFAAFISDQT